MKKVIAILIAMFLVIKVVLFDTYALSVAPVFGEVLVELSGSLLVGSGMYTTEQVGDMSWYECETAIESGLSSGQINPLDITGNVTYIGGDGTETTVQANYIEWVDYLTNPDTEIVASDLLVGATPLDKIREAITEVINYAMPEVKANWVHGLKTSDVRNVRTFDMKGAGAILCSNSNYAGTGNWEYIYYGVGPGYVDKNGYYYIEYYQKAIAYSNGTVKYVEENSMVHVGMSADCVIYGDWVNYSDGTAVETESTEVAEVGETEDGETVTLDDIQSGAVSLDDTTLDYDSFNDEAIIDLLQQILAEMKQVPVVEDTADNTLAEDFAQELEGSVALEVEDVQALQLPTGIASVFPFCLPFDFAYGIQLFAHKPVAPVFEIPFEIPAFGLYPGTSDTITLDMSEYSKYFEVGRWVQVVIFLIGLCFISFKIVKGVH